MKLVTKAMEKTLPALYSTEKVPVSKKRVWAKFFTPDANWTWWVFEGQKQGDDLLFFGAVQGLEAELGYFMLKELESLTGPFGLKVERDLYYDQSDWEERDSRLFAR